MADLDVTRFTSYEVSRVVEALVAAATEHPSAPARHALRGACVAHLAWNNYYRTCWDDPGWAWRYYALRAELGITADSETGLDLAVGRAQDLLTAIVTLEDETPF